MINIIFILKASTTSLANNIGTNYGTSRHWQLVSLSLVMKAKDRQRHLSVLLLFRAALVGK